MNKRRHAKIIREGNYVAEIMVEMIYADEGWSPYLSLDDSYKLDEVRETLRRGDLQSAVKLAKIYTLVPISA